HQLYSDDSVKKWVQEGCLSAGIGCLDCKQHIVESVEKEIQPIRERAQEYNANRDLVRSVISEGCEAAREEARQTLIDVREAMGLGYT
ncbi:MAG: tryptophan--tRNA ligase, partial [Gammaproteobacteria bacterium]